MKELIVDCGTHLGEDSEIYLSNGYRVLAIDASPSICKLLEEKFSKEIETGDFEIKNIAISNSIGKIKFFESEESLWNSLKKDIANRHEKLKNEIEVECSTLSNIISKLKTTPKYIKIDIEGYDYDTIMSLKNLEKNRLPKYISCETECLGEHEIITIDESLKTLNALHDVGYTKFKLVDKATISPATFDNYKKLVRTMWLAPSASGPFGEEIECNWMLYEQAKILLTTFRHWFFNQQHLNYQFWSDWHAKL